MANVNVRNLPDAAHPAPHVRAEMHDHSTEAEVRDARTEAVIPPERVRLGSLLNAIAREVGGLSDEEAEHINQLRDQTPAQPMRVEKSPSTRASPCKGFKRLWIRG